MSGALVSVLQFTPLPALALAGMLAATAVLALCSAGADVIRMVIRGGTG